MDGAMYITRGLEFEGCPLLWIEVDGRYFCYEVYNPEDETLKYIEDTPLRKFYKNNPILKKKGILNSLEMIANIHNRNVLVAENYEVLKTLGTLEPVFPYKDKRVLNFYNNACRGIFKRRDYLSFILAFPNSLKGDSRILLNWAARIGEMLYTNNLFDPTIYSQKVKDFENMLFKIISMLPAGPHQDMAVATLSNFTPEIPCEKKSSYFNICFSWSGRKRRAVAPPPTNLMPTLQSNTSGPLGDRVGSSNSSDSRLIIDERVLMQPNIGLTKSCMDFSINQLLLDSTATKLKEIFFEGERIDQNFPRVDPSSKDISIADIFSAPDLLGAPPAPPRGSDAEQLLDFNSPEVLAETRMNNLLARNSDSIDDNFPKGNFAKEKQANQDLTEAALSSEDTSTTDIFSDLEPLSVLPTPRGSDAETQLLDVYSSKIIAEIDARITASIEEFNSNFGPRKQATVSVKRKQHPIFEFYDGSFYPHWDSLEPVIANLQQPPAFYLGPSEILEEKGIKGSNTETQLLDVNSPEVLAETRMNNLLERNSDSIDDNFPKENLAKEKQTNQDWVEAGLSSKDTSTTDIFSDLEPLSVLPTPRGGNTETQLLDVYSSKIIAEIDARITASIEEFNPNFGPRKQATVSVKRKQHLIFKFCGESFYPHWDSLEPVANLQQPSVFCLGPDEILEEQETKSRRLEL